jgi:hypothetical protein
MTDEAARALWAHHHRRHKRRWWHRRRPVAFEELPRHEQRHWRAMALVAWASFESTRRAYLPNWATVDLDPLDPPPGP